MTTTPALRTINAPAEFAAAVLWFVATATHARRTLATWFQVASTRTTRCRAMTAMRVRRMTRVATVLVTEEQLRIATTATCARTIHAVR